jgi:hypothetical protein
MCSDSTERKLLGVLVRGAACAAGEALASVGSVAMVVCFSRTQLLGCSLVDVKDFFFT